MKPRCISCVYAVPSQIRSNPPRCDCIKKDGKEELHCERGCEHFSMMHPYLLAERLRKHPMPTKKF